MFNILHYGAVADGNTLNTDAIQRAIDDCNAAGGGRVTIPAGIFKTGTIWLRSNVELHLSMGSTLLASDNMDDYNAEDAYPQNFGCTWEQWVGKHLIIAHEIENVAITGFGTVDGNCYAFEEDWFHEDWFRWRGGSFKCKDPIKMRPGQLIVFIECKNVRIHDYTVRNSGCWSTFFHGCEYINVRGYKVFNPLNMRTSDGLDIDCCRYVTVSDCILHTGDDGIAIRSAESYLKNKEIHSEYITITNCIIHAHVCAIRIGVGTGSIRHVNISNITVSRCRELVQFASSYLGRTRSCIEDVYISGISATDTERAISLFSSNGAYVKDITIENIRSEATAMSYIHQNDGIVDNIRLRNFEIIAWDRYDNLDDEHLDLRGHYIFSVKNATNVVLEDVRIRGDFTQKNDRVQFENCDDIQLINCVF